VQDRATALGIGKEYCKLSRLIDRKCTPKMKAMQSRAMGHREDYLLNVPGRSCFDLMEYMQRNEKLPSYSLNAVAAKFLGDKKEDVPFWHIRPLYMSGPKGRMTVNKYCLKDCKLPWDIIDKKLIFVNCFEMARVVGVPFKWLLERGQQAKTQSKLLRCTRANGYLLPTQSPPKRPYKGAIVVKPDKGYYNIPIVVLDFSSLYPSIMIANNLCYSTYFLLKHAILLGLKPEDYTVPNIELNGREPFGFVKPHIRKGILPMILMDLLGSRGIAKKDLAAAIAEKLYALAKIMDGRQLALKMTANSVYGFTSANNLPLTEIAETVTGIGRDMIQLSTKLIEAHFLTTTIDTLSCMRSGFDPNLLQITTNNSYLINCTGNEFALANQKETSKNELDSKNQIVMPDLYKFVKYFIKDAHVVYGDTDSVMVDCGDISVARALELGKEMSSYLKRYFLPPNDMLFEKVYYPYLLVSKKRYAALFWTKADKHDKMDVKGLESARRDWSGICTKVQEGALQQLLFHRNLQGAVDVVHKACSDLLTNKVNIFDIILTKGFTQPLANYALSGSSPPHICVVKKRIKRDPATAPRVGERVTYVMVQGTEKKTGDRAEDPLYVMENNILIDGNWYIQNQLVKPCIRLLQAALCKDPMELDDPNKVYKKKPQLTYAYKILFQGEHMRSKKQQVRNGGFMSTFFTRTQSCIVCRVKCVNGSTTCANPECKEIAKNTALDQSRIEFRLASAKLNQAKQTCVTCQKGTPYDSIICENKTCNNWYHRFKTSIDFKDQQKMISRFSLDDW
jgi:DNA polymerase delta subunit 1